MTSGRNPGIEPIGDCLRAGNPEEERERPSAGQVGEERGQRAGAGVDPPVWSDQLHGAVERLVGNRRQVRQGGSLGPGESLDRSSAVPSTKPGDPLPTKAALPVEEQYRTAQQFEISSWPQACGTSRMAASEREVRIALRPLRESPALGAKARLAGETSKRALVGSIQNWVPGEPLRPDAPLRLRRPNV